MPASLRALVVDDEPIARQILCQELVGMNNIELLGEAEDGESALAKISNLKPDLVFLDIQMPAMSGFEVLDKIADGPWPVVVMVTAFDQFAIRAFEAGALDYLLKPVSPQRLMQSIERAVRLHRNPLAVIENVAHLQQVAAPGLKKVVGRSGGEYFLLNPDEVLAFQADGDLVWILTAKQRYMATQNLKTLEEKLGTASFRRVHRNALVNINQIRKMSLLTSQRWLITMNNGVEFIVSKRQAHSVRDVLHL